MDTLSTEMWPDMTDGLLLPPGGGRRIQNMTMKVGAERSKAFSTFEAEIAPGFDVGAHLKDDLLKRLVLGTSCNHLCIGIR